jgi:alpha-1,3-mannosyltransferase
LGTDIASQLLYGSVFPHNLNGTDFVPLYLDSSSHKLRIFLLGARPEVVERVRERFKIRWPQHEVVGAHHGYFNASHSPELTAQVGAAQADIVLVAMGNPRQEMWAAENALQTAPVVLCVGALFDFIAKEFARAPHWVRATRLEWAFRLILEPRRLWARYTGRSFLFFLNVLRQYTSGARA